MEHQHQPETPAKMATEDNSKMDRSTRLHGDNPSMDMEEHNH